MLAVVFAVKSADEPFKGFFVGELLFQLCMMLQNLVVIFNQVGCIDRRTDALREFLTYSPRLKPGDSGVEQELPSRDGLTFPNPTDDAPPVLS